MNDRESAERWVKRAIDKFGKEKAVQEAKRTISMLEFNLSRGSGLAEMALPSVRLRLKILKKETSAR